MVKKALPLHKESFSEKKLELPALAGFDLETDGLGGKFILGAIWTSDDERVLFNNLGDLFSWIVDHPKYRYLAHNASGYEFSYLYPLVFDFFSSNPNVELRPTIQGDSRIVQLIIEIKDPEKLTRRGKPTKTIIDLRDTLCLFNMSLEKVAKAFCPELPKLKGNINFEKETFNPENPIHIDYLWRDCEIVWKAYTKHWNDVVEVFGCPLGVTAGSTALKAFKTTIPDTHVYYRTNKDAEAFIRKAYYGGLVLPGRNVGQWGPIGSIDVNGAYAYQMSNHLFPVGSPAATHSFNPDRVGFYHCRCIVPDSVYDTLGFNPIPRRDDKGLCWPSGTFDTYISTPEILYARGRGCTVEVLCGYEFQRLEPVFNNFIDKCQEMEKFENFKFKPTIKGIRNSCYGKFGSKTTHKTLKFSHEILTIRDGYNPVVNKNNGSLIDGLYTGQEEQEADYMMPHWAALITAYERLYIMEVAELAYKMGAKNVYCDTDSVKCDLPIMTKIIEQKLVPIGDNYGQFKAEEICREFYLLGGKCFFGETDDPKKPYLIKAKGIPNRSLDKESYIKGLRALEKESPKKEDKEGKIFFDSTKSLMKIIKENSRITPLRPNRRITDMRNSYAWQITEEGKIYPRGYTVVGQDTDNRRTIIRTGEHFGNLEKSILPLRSG